jgi:hypothetical protein
MNKISNISALTRTFAQVYDTPSKLALVLYANPGLVDPEDIWCRSFEQLAWAVARRQREPGTPDVFEMMLRTRPQHIEVIERSYVELLHRDMPEELIRLSLEAGVGQLDLVRHLTMRLMPRDWPTPRQAADRQELDNIVHQRLLRADKDPRVLLRDLGQHVYDQYLLEGRGEPEHGPLLNLAPERLDSYVSVSDYSLWRAYDARSLARREAVTMTGRTMRSGGTVHRVLLMPSDPPKAARGEFLLADELASSLLLPLLMDLVFSAWGPGAYRTSTVMGAASSQPWAFIRGRTEGRVHQVVAKVGADGRRHILSSMPETDEQAFEDGGDLALEFLAA